MKNLLFILFLFGVSSCGQNYNSNYSDQGTYGDIGITAGSNLYYAYRAMQSNHCLACHPGWTNFKTSQQWINEGLIVSGSLTNSSIYTILKNNGGTMPKEPYSALTTEDLNAIKTWINNP